MRLLISLGVGLQEVIFRRLATAWRRDGKSLPSGFLSTDERLGVMPSLFHKIIFYSSQWGVDRDIFSLLLNLSSSNMLIETNKNVNSASINGTSLSVRDEHIRKWRISSDSILFVDPCH